MASLQLYLRTQHEHSKCNDTQSRISYGTLY